MTPYSTPARAVAVALSLLPITGCTGGPGNENDTATGSTGSTG